jgi:hypothetical protein
VWARVLAGRIYLEFTARKLFLRTLNVNSFAPDCLPTPGRSELFNKTVLAGGGLMPAKWSLTNKCTKFDSIEVNSDKEFLTRSIEINCSAF